MESNLEPLGSSFRGLFRAEVWPFPTRPLPSRSWGRGLSLLPASAGSASREIEMYTLHAAFRVFAFFPGHGGLLAWREPRPVPGKRASPPATPGEPKKNRRPLSFVLPFKEMIPFPLQEEGAVSLHHAPAGVVVFAAPPLAFSPCPPPRPVISLGELGRSSSPRLFLLSKAGRNSDLSLAAAHIFSSTPRCAFAFRDPLGEKAEPGGPLAKTQWSGRQWALGALRFRAAAL